MNVCYSRDEEATLLQLVHDIGPRDDIHGDSGGGMTTIPDDEMLDAVQAGCQTSGEISESKATLTRRDKRRVEGEV